MAARFSRELAADLKAMAEDTGQTVADIVRAGAENEVKKWKRRSKA